MSMGVEPIDVLSKEDVDLFIGKVVRTEAWYLDSLTGSRSFLS